MDTMVLGMYAMTAVGVFALMRLAASAVGNFRSESQETYFSARSRKQIGNVLIGVSLRAQMHLSAALAILSAALCVVFLGSILLGLVLAALCMVTPYFIRRRAQAKRLAQFEEQFPEALSLLSSTLRAGISLPLAVSKIAEESEEPLSEEFGMLRREIQLGRTEQGFRELADRVPLESVKLFVTAVSTCLKLGGNLAEMSDSIADTIRRNIELRGELRAMTAEGKLQGMMMGAMPFGVAAILALINPDLMEPLITHWIGNLIIGIVVVLELIGAVVINELLKIED